MKMLKLPIRFDVIVPIYYGERFLADTLAAIGCQTYQCIDSCICVVQPGTDNSENIVDQYDDRLDGINQLHLVKCNLSVANKSLALNAAIQISNSADWIALCDADDLWYPDKLEKQAEFIQRHPDVEVVGTQMEYIDENGDPWKDVAPILPTSTVEIHASLDKNINPIANSSVVYRKELHKTKLGYYDPFNAVEDYDMWRRARFVNCQMMNLAEVLLKHRLHSKSNFNDSEKQALDKNLTDSVWHTKAALRGMTK